ncbi:MAG: IclR family transcriptional regulator C-terminal domain-containing protein, partial [Anaerolineae bacterium]
PKTITDREKLREELRKTRERGYAIDNEEFHEGTVCVAALVRDYRGRATSAISISLPKSRFSRKSFRIAYIQQVQDTAVRISEEQGFQGLEVDSPPT